MKKQMSNYKTEEQTEANNEAGKKAAVDSERESVFTKGLCKQRGETTSCMDSCDFSTPGFTYNEDYKLGPLEINNLLLPFQE